jgi:glucokinase
VSVLAAEAGNLARRTPATGGVHPGRGVRRRVLPAVTDRRLLAAFRRTSRFAGMLARVPGRVTRRPGVALLGAARHGFEALAG